MSIIIFMLFLGYASVRTAFWIRGRVALWRLEPTLPTPEEPRPVPAHIGTDASTLFRRSNEMRRAMTTHHRAIASALITDPDVPLGVVRSATYRRAVRRGADELRGYVAVLEELAPSLLVRIEGTGADPERLRRLSDRLDASARHVGRTRDFEPFPVGEVEAVGDCFGQVTAELKAFEDAIEFPAGHPYRATQSSALAPVIAASH